MAGVTIFKDIFTQKPYHTTLGMALKRIKSGNSQSTIERIRKEASHEKRNALKKHLPCVLFSGTFKSRKDEDIITHSGYVVLDFDEVKTGARNQIESKDFVYACWDSPSGNGLKALVRIADPSKHRQHLRALFELLPEADAVNINEARVCYESYDPGIYINEKAKVFDKVFERKIESQSVDDEGEIFLKLQKWITSSGNAFVSGSRNIFIFKLAGACCRFGIHESDCFHFIQNAYLTHDSEFSINETERTISSAYRSNRSSQGSAVFENDKVVERITRHEIDPSVFDETIKPRDVVYGMDVVEDALRLYDYGYESAETTHIDILDKHYKFKRGELTLLSGIGNYGKSSFLEHILLIRSFYHGAKWAMFVPEAFPAHEFYHNLTEAYLGADCSPGNTMRPSRDRFAEAYKKISGWFYFVFPKEAPTPERIQERFLELVIKEKIDGVVIDPFNQLANEWGERDDKYLEKFLSGCLKFARECNVFFFIINHPKLLRKADDGNYPCPDVFDLANGAMWNNKMDNILIYHRPYHQTNPSDQTCQLHVKKIRRQRIVGIPGTVEFEYDRRLRRFLFDGKSPLNEQLQPQNWEDPF